MWTITEETVPEIEGEGYGSRGIGEKGLVSVFFGNGLFGVNGIIMMFFKRLIMVNRRREIEFEG